MKKTALTIIVAGFIAGAAHAEMGQEVYLDKGCNTCHGVDAAGVDGKGASLAGKPQDQLEVAIRKFRDNKGQHQQEMEPSDNCDVPLSDEDVTAMAKWLSRT